MDQNNLQNNQASQQNPFVNGATQVPQDQSQMMQSQNPMGQQIASNQPFNNMPQSSNQASAPVDPAMSGANPQGQPAGQATQPQMGGAQPVPPGYKGPFQALLATQPRRFEEPIYKLITQLVDLRYQGQLSEEVKRFEIARVYNKLEIIIYEISISGLTDEQQTELQRLTEAAQTSGDPAMSQKIAQFMAQYAPNAQTEINNYIMGFQNEYLAGRY